MGNGPYVKVHPDAESPTCLGAKSALSDPIDDFCDYATFFEELIPRLRDPVHPLEQYVLKSLEVVDHGPQEFTVKIILNGELLTRLGVGKPDGSDVVRRWQRVAHSHEDRMIIFEEYGEDGKPYATNKLKFLEDPFRVEVWSDWITGERFSGPILAWSTETFYITPIIRNVIHRKVMVRREVDSPGGTGKCCLSDPLDGYLTFDAITEGLPEVMKTMCEKTFGTVEEISPTEFEMRHPVKVPRALVEAEGSTGSDTAALKEETLHEKTSAQARKGATASGQAQDVQLDLSIFRDMKTVCTVKHFVRFDPKKGEFNMVTTNNDQLENTTCIVLHESPLRMELWCVYSDSVRHAGRVERNVLQDYVNALIHRSDGLAGWFF
mmetsp:Transcript_5062/g.15626  ORF Transcript_5062/g.15626 Transcript_5062/m.15626 type:complete len:379 (+) Transcript_5062:77-1213(+)